MVKHLIFATLLLLVLFVEGLRIYDEYIDGNWFKKYDYGPKYWMYLIFRMILIIYLIVHTVVATLPPEQQGPPKIIFVNSYSEVPF